MPTPAPLHTQESLAADLVQLGLRKGDSVIVHSSLRAIGRVVGGPVSVLLALEQVLTSAGNLLMPTFTEHLCDPAEGVAAYPEAEQDLVRAHLPLFHPDLTPVDRDNGFLSEIFRKQNTVRRSFHPHLSFAAWGKDAAAITQNHPFDNALGADSPLGALYRRQGKVLLLGAATDSITALHLAEYSVDSIVQAGKAWDAKIYRDGKAQWVQYRDIDQNSDFFPALVDSYIQAEGQHNKGVFGQAQSYLFPLVDLIDYGVDWLRKNR